MLISHKHRFIFIHIVKTAGTSITSVFFPYARPLDRLIYGYWPSRRFFNFYNILMKRKGIEFLTGFNKHATAIEAKMKLPPNIYDNYFKFAFVRNPWDLSVSLYFYLRQNRKSPDFNEVRKMDFSDFVRWQIKRRIPRQIDFISDQHHNLIIDFVGKYEYLNRDIKFIGNRLNLHLLPLPMLNISNSRQFRDYRTLYNPETKKLVGEYFGKDAEIFGYSFEGGI